MNDWNWLKEKCIDCYELNRYRDIRDAITGYFEKDKAILTPRYCEKHEVEIEEIRRMISHE